MNGLRKAIGVQLLIYDAVGRILKSSKKVVSLTDLGTM